MQTILLIILIAALAAYTVTLAADILAARKTLRTLDDVTDMVLMLREDLEQAQSHAPRLVSLKPTEKGSRQ